MMNKFVFVFVVLVSVGFGTREEQKDFHLEKISNFITFFNSCLMKNHIRDKDVLNFFKTMELNSHKIIAPKINARVIEKTMRIEMDVLTKKACALILDHFGKDIEVDVKELIDLFRLEV